MADTTNLSNAADVGSDLSVTTVSVQPAPVMRIYSAVAPESRFDQLQSQLSRIREMGFTHLLVSGAAFGTDASTAAGEVVGKPWVASTLSLALRSAADLCADHGLQLLLDVDIAGVVSEAALRVDHPDWFQAVHSPDVALDPRRLSAGVGDRWRLNDARAADAALAWWNQQLLEWVGAGVAGFRLMSMDAAPAAWWKALCDNVHVQASNTRMLAWTQGLKVPALTALVGTGFDHTFCSAEWWDYRGAWLAVEYRRMAAVAPPLACAGAPASPSQVQTKTEIARRRAVWFAASLGAGWLMPAGFEHPDESSAQPNGLLASGFDLTADVAAANASVKADRVDATALPALHTGVGWVAVLRVKADAASLLLVNASLDRPVLADFAAVATGMACDFAPWHDDGDEKMIADGKLAPGQARRLQAVRALPVLERVAAPVLRKRLDAATRAPRIAIEAVTPSVDDGHFPVKCVVGASVSVSADVFMDGHDVLAVALCWRACDDDFWQEQRMVPLGNDRYAATLMPSRIGRHEFAIRAWRDAYASYHHELVVKHDAQIPITLELQEGRKLLEETIAATAPERTQSLREVLQELASASDDEERYQRMIAADTAQAMTQADPRPFAVQSLVLPLEVDRRAAQFASWYELFPRSQTEDPARHGNFRDVMTRLPAIREMGFDVLYFPPIHPIGDAFRKGRNNTLSPTPEDPGSPYAIGSPEGGHTAIHAQLGTIEDFRALRDAALEQGLELALDFAIQCSPDHPWLREHPEWFDWRPDGSLRYAENPPKKYQDIVNVDFYSEGAVPSLWQALCDVVLYWAAEGVRTFRVDNPHTKPFPFWEWMFARVRSQYPDALFLAEAFTRPKPMYRLAKAGFSQSYTYFTWRHTKEEFTEYLTELSQGPAKDFFRPNFFVNTPDINPYFLQRSGRAGFLIRAALATTLSGLWGMYSGFELCEAAALTGREEYLDSEKYEIRPRDWAMPGNIVAEISQLNAIRRAQPALQSHLGVRFLQSDDPDVLFFERFVPHGPEVEQPLDRILVAIQLDPSAERSTDLHLPLADWGLADDAVLLVQDLLHDATSTWRGARQHVWLGRGMPYAIWHLQERI